MVATVYFVAVLLGIAAADIVPDEYFEGEGTSYTLSEVSSGNCNFMSAIPTASTNFAALNEEQWNTLGNCGRCVEVSCIDDLCTVKNQTAVVQVLDRCPECAHGALDLSPTVFKDITGLEPHRLKVRWRFVDCPDAGNVQVCLKEGSSSSWIAVQPTNGLVGIKSVTLNGATTTMLDGAYYYVSTTANADLSAVKVAMTSVNGDEISGTYSLSVGKCTDTKKQFASGSSSQTETQTTLDPTYTPAATPAPATATPKTTPVTPTSGYAPVTPEAQGSSTESAPEATTPKATTATPKDTPSTVSTPEPTTATSEYAPITPEAQGSSADVTPEAPTATPKDTPVTPEVQGPSAESSPEVTPKASPATPKDTPGTLEAPEAQGPSTEATTEATPATPKDRPVTPVTPEAQGPSVEAPPEATTTSPEATKASDVPVQSGDTPKCHVRGHRQRN